MKIDLITLLSWVIRWNRIECWPNNPTHHLEDDGLATQSASGLSNNSLSRNSSIVLLCSSKQANSQYETAVFISPYSAPVLVSTNVVNLPIDCPFHRRAVRTPFLPAKQPHKPPVVDTLLFAYLQLICLMPCFNTSFSVYDNAGVLVSCPRSVSFLW